MTEPVLSVRGLCKQFDALRVSRDISLDVLPGEIHALIGPNGAGKSSLIAQIAGELQPDAGRIFLNGRDVSAMDVPARARLGLARTFQVSELAMQDTVMNNVLLGAIGAGNSAFRLFSPVSNDTELKQTVTPVLQRMGLAEVVDKPASDLSHGQRRQLEMAIALTLAPCVFVMDEPMAGIGTQGTHQMMQVLDELRNDAPILMVEHDMEAVFSLADRISVLVYGEIIATGTPDEIKANIQVREAYLGDTV